MLVMLYVQRVLRILLRTNAAFQWQFWSAPSQRNAPQQLRCCSNGTIWSARTWSCVLQWQEKSPQIRPRAAPKMLESLRLFSWNKSEADSDRLVDNGQVTPRSKAAPKPFQWESRKSDLKRSDDVTLSQSDRSSSELEQLFGALQTCHWKAA